MTDKIVLEAALKLPVKARRKIAKKLLESVEAQELQESILEGAKIAEKRLSDLRIGKSRKVTAEEVEELLSRRAKR